MSDSVKVKICGLTEEHSVQAVIDAGSDFAGFVYYSRSPRHIGLQRAAELARALPPHIHAVSVMVDPNDTQLDQVATLFRAPYVQLHGNETPERVQAVRERFGFKIIKAIAVRSTEDIAKAAEYTSADVLMFDAKPSADAMLPGGNGISFDWTLLQGRQFAKPWFLTGGLTPANVAQAIAQSGAAMVDVSSGVETAPGVKDAALIDAFVKAVKHEA